MGSRIGRYEIVTNLGSGGMAQVYLALQRGPFGAAKLVVVKQLRPDVAEDPEFVSLFADEARIALRLNHRNVVHTHEVVVEPGRYFMAMEFLEGQSLFEIRRRLGPAKLPLETHIWILTQVLAGLHYAHELLDFDGKPLGIVHRDVSPSNVLVTNDGEVKLLDFGIAKSTSALSTTKEGIVKGKIGYAAPEQLLGRAVDARADIYAVGVMLWEAMAGRRRASGDTYLAMLQARIQGSEAPIDAVWVDAPPSLVKVCQRALATDPADRYSTALEFERELAAYLAGSDAPAGPNHLAALVNRHFERDAETLRGYIATAMAVVPGEGHDVPPLPAFGPPVEVEHAQTRIGRRRRAVPWLSVVALVLVAGLVGRTLHRPRSTAVAQPPMPVPAETAAPPLPTSIAPPASVPTETQPHDVPEPTRSAEETVSTVHPQNVRPPPTVLARKKRDEGRAQAPAPPAPPVSARADSSTEAPQDENRSEPGTDLRKLGSARTAHSIDEKDPYTP